MENFGRFAVLPLCLMTMLESEFLFHYYSDPFGGGGPFTSAFVMPAGIFHQAVERAQSHRRTHRPPFLPVQKPPWAVVEGQGYGATLRR